VYRENNARFRNSFAKPRGADAVQSSQTAAAVAQTMKALGFYIVTTPETS
jgi:hypothetical protein